jgi:predicted PurR-regulated permease PerM
METVPGEDLGLRKEELTPDRLGTGGHRVEDRPAMPWAWDARTIFLGILCLIAVLACLYIAQDIVVPVVLALVLKLLFQSLVSLLERVHVPRVAGALIALAVLVSVFVGLGTLLSSPAAQWVSQLPQTWPQLQQKFEIIRHRSSTCSTRSARWASSSAAHHQYFPILLAWQRRCWAAPVP